LESTIYVVAGIVVLLLLARHFATRRGPASASEAQVRASVLQSYLVSCVDELRQVLAQKGKEPETLRREAYDILAKMESRNTGGNLDDFIRDNRESVDLALKRGDAV